MADLTTATMISTDQASAQMTQTTTSQKPMNEQEELELEVVDPLYSWAKDDDERRRTYILSCANFNPDMHIDISISQLNSLERWVKGQSR